MNTIITLESLKAEQNRLSALIAQYEAQPVKWDRPLQVSIPRLDKGEHWAGTLITPSRREHIIVMPDDFDPAPHEIQMERARSVGGELCDRVEGALAFAELRELFHQAVYWTRELHVSDPDYAWTQDFTTGAQLNWDTSSKLRARAFRRIKIGE